MLKPILTLLIALFSMHLLIAQDAEQEVLLTIDGQEVTCSEFERIYTKNNQDAAYDSASLEEYMKLFVNFKLKVMEAEALGMDTIKSFIKELKGYRNQLEKPYFADENTDEELVKEAYERMGLNVKASHILVKCDKNALPKDTLKAYNKLNGIRKQAVKGEDFVALAKQYSEDPSVEQNGGDLGYFTAFAMVYPFESAAFNTPVGEMSEIFRTSYGYHFLKVVDKIKDQGRRQVAHIMRAVPKGSSKEKEQEEMEYINTVYDSIMAGEPFGKMAYFHSTDKRSSRNGGELKFFGVGNMVPEFEKASFALENIGDVAKPIRTSYGFHIIKLLAIDSLRSLDEMREIIKKRISKDIRAERGKQLVITTLKKEYNVTEYKQHVVPFYTAIDSSIYKGSWDGSGFKGGQEVLLTIADTNKFTQDDFAAFITMDKRRRRMKPFELIINTDFERFVEERVVEFEKSRLEDKYPSFKHLVKEYHDGILLFNLTDELVWSKAVEDTIGLEKFYAENKGNYMWGDRIEATIYTFNKKELEKKVASLASKVGRKNKNVIEAKAGFLAKEAAKDTTITLEIEKNKFSKGDNGIIDGVTWDVGLKDIRERDDKFIIVYINGKVAPQPKQLNEARGLITADYQSYLEEIWLSKLREKYKLVVNKEVFNSLIK
ncbi:MAG: peptidylprolyl isomerase [Salinivirgaceae bacterium]|jgi:peptidyl-prolyl cis-trans isomerase SurA|nr:peptidylprolyl isomerase [Salinivirgaceae bacterium]